MSFLLNPYLFNSSVKDGLVLSYDFARGDSYSGAGNTVNNIVNSFYNGTLLNSPIYTNEFGGGLVLDGTNKCINLGDILDNVFCGVVAKFSLECWVKFNQLNANTNYVLCAKNGDGNFSEDQRQFFWTARNISNLSYGGVRLDFIYYGGLVTNPVKAIRSDTAILSTGQVYHLVMTFDNSITTNVGMDRVRLYVNGTEQNRVMWLNNENNFPYVAIQNGTARLGIGGQLGTVAGPIGTLNGVIYLSNIYNKVLSPTEVSTNWNAIKPRFGL